MAFMDVSYAPNSRSWGINTRMKALRPLFVDTCILFPKPANHKVWKTKRKLKIIIFITVGWLWLFFCVFSFSVKVETVSFNSQLHNVYNFRKWKLKQLLTILSLEIDPSILVTSGAHYSEYLSRDQSQYIFKIKTNA